MYDETKETIVERITRTIDRFLNAGFSQILPLVDAYVPQLAVAKDVDTALGIEREFLDVCNSTYAQDSNAAFMAASAGMAASGYDDPQQKLQQGADQG